MTSLITKSNFADNSASLIFAVVSQSRSADQDYGLQEEMQMEGQDVVIKQSGNDSED